MKSSTPLGQNGWRRQGSLQQLTPSRCWLLPSLALLLATSGCASSQPLTRAEALELGVRSWDAPTDEVFDATWLTLRAQGAQVTQPDRLAGTLVAKRGAQTWEVDVAALGSEQRVQLSPREGVSRGDLVDLLDGLERGTRTLLRAWRELPEWAYDGRRNVLSVPGFGACPPREWEWLDFDISRRHVVVQHHRERTGLNATLLVDVDRRRPETQLVEAIQRATGLTLGARQRLVFPDELESTQDASGLHGSIRVLDGTLPLDVVWHAFQTVLGPSDVRLVMVCPQAAESTCSALWATMARSIIQ